jgi:phosphopantothenoylcysteine synthetase/decarboxylase
VARILLACGASAALHKACDLASKLAQEGHLVRTLLTNESKTQIVAVALDDAARAAIGAFLNDEKPASKRA